MVPHPTAAYPSLVSTKLAQLIKFTDYSRYRFRAEVDWIELKIVLTNPSNFQTVRRRLGVEYAEADAPSIGGAGVEFTAKIQAPSSWAEVEARLERLTADHPLAQPVAVTGIEIALDAYSLAQSHDELVEMAGRFYREACKLVCHNRRASRAKGDRAYQLTSVDQLRRLLAAGYNIYIGDRSAPERQHIYVKETDGQLMLPLDKHRARTEFTLTGAKVTKSLFNEWRDHEFEQFAPYFKFRRLKTHLPPMIEKPMRIAAQVGERRRRKTRYGTYRCFSSATEADAKLNALAYDALRDLSRRWKTGRKDK